MSVNNVMKRTETICSRIKSSWHGIARMYNIRAEEHDFSISMAYVLINLSTKRGIPSTQIGPMVGIESRSLTRILKRMEELEIICKEVGKEDRRKVMIFLTEEGKKSKAKAKQIIKDFNKKVESEIPPEKLSTFIEVLTKINKISETNHLPT